MGLDVTNELFGNFHTNWAGASWLQTWCAQHQLPQPFIGWESGGNNGDRCRLGENQTHNLLAVEWCKALKKKFPEIANLGKSLFEKPPTDLYSYLYPHKSDGTEEISDDEWSRRAIAAWYAILRNGVEHGDILEYW
jgi:hypothetical protein